MRQLMSNITASF